jgi:adenosylhomocysteinase
VIPESLLSAYDHSGVRWAAAHMPLLHDTMQRSGHVFDGLRVGICLHIEPKTAVLATLLARAGASVRLTGSPGTTKADVAAALQDTGVEVTTAAGVLDLEPDLLLDNGADLTLGLLERGVPAHFRGGTEETTTGALRLREGGHDNLPFPVVVINDSPLKQLVENRFGVGQSVVQGFMNATNRMLPGARALVLGYGPCGRGVAQTLRLLGARVTVAEPDPYRRLEAVLEGHTVGPAAGLLPAADLVFLATGRTGVLGPDEVARLRDGVVLAGVGHRGDEVDLTLLGVPGPVTGTHHRTYLLGDGRRVNVLAETRMINLVAAGGNPIEAMDLGLTLQAASLAAIAGGEVGPGVQPVPDAIDRRVAEEFTATLT